MLTIELFLNEFALVVAALAGLCIVHLRSQRGDDMPAYYYLSVWLVSSVCMGQLGDDLSHWAERSAEVDHVYLPRTVFAIERIAVVISLQFGIGYRLASRYVERINFILSGTIAIAFVGILAYGYLFDRDTTTIDAKFKKVEKEIQANREISKVDTAKAAQLQRQVDTLTNELTHVRSDNADLKNQLKSANDQLQKLVGVVISLRRFIDKLSTSVERTRKTISAPVPTLKPTAPTGLIPPEKVETTSPTMPATKPNPN